MEKQRVDYEKRVTDLDNTIKDLERTGNVLRSRIQELETTLVRYQDVDAQLRQSK
jgi:chromosome segregation ATPase